MSDDTRDLAQRIRDALAGTTPIAFDERAGILGEVDENGVFRVWEQPVFTLTNIALIVAAPSLLRDALARIEADAATIAALQEAVRERNAALADVWCYAGNGGERPAPAQVADAVHEMWRYKLSLEDGLPDDDAR